MRLLSDMLAEGGKTNSLGLAEEVVHIVIESKGRLEELYGCLFHEDAWVRMRAADALEKICRLHPEWFKDYVDRFFNEISGSGQASIQWHFAQILGEVSLTNAQLKQAIDWLSQKLQTTDVDWIVAANCMATLSQFVDKGYYPKERLIPLLKCQQQHRSKSVVRRATKLLGSF